MLRRMVVATVVAIPLALAGCSVVIEPTYTPDELAWQCVRNGGVWRPYVNDGYCEIQSPGFL